MLAGKSLSVRCVAGSLIFLSVAAQFPARLSPIVPFDGTDAAVAAPGELEVELQPTGLRHEGGTQTLVAPWTVPEFWIE